MAKSKGLPSIFCLVLMVFLQSNSCTSCSGVPSNFNSVVLHASSRTIGAGQTVTITATVPRDTTGAGVTWVFTPGAGAPVPPGVFTPTGVNSATYAAPTTAIGAQFTVSIQATSIAFPTGDRFHNHHDSAHGGAEDHNYHVAERNCRHCLSGRDAVTG